MAVKLARTLGQLKLDATNGGWGAWCNHWGRDPTDMHPNDERALLEGCYFDLASANRIHAFYERFLTVPKDGKVVRFELYDFWFRDVLGPLFGWKRASGKRRFDKGFVTTAKKSGKSSTLSGLPIYMISCDGELEAEAYSTAVDRDQASIIYRKTERMVRKSHPLRTRLKITPSQKRIYDEQTGSWYEAISSDADSADGKNPHLLIADELHRWRDRSFFNALMYGDISREQPLFLMITTAGDDLECVGFEEYEFARDLLDPTNDVYSMSHFAVIQEAGFDRDEQSGEVKRDENGNPVRFAWDDPRGWLEANPILAEENRERVLDKLHDKCNEAKVSPRKKREFMRFICNWWVSDVHDTYLARDSWLQCCGDVMPANNATCAIGLDLSSVIDITALCVAFRSGDVFELMWRFWKPQDTVADHEERDRVPYRDWAEDGWLELTPGARVDYSYVRRAISGVQLDEMGAALPIQYGDAVALKYRLLGVGYDPWNSEKLVGELAKYDGLTTYEIRQGYRSLSQPCKRFRELVLDGKVRHGGNPIADWMSRNAVIDEDPAGNIKLNKAKSRKRIDGIVAAVMAVATYESLEQASGAWSGAGTGMYG